MRQLASACGKNPRRHYVLEGHKIALCGFVPWIASRWVQAPKSARTCTVCHTLKQQGLERLKKDLSCRS